MKKAGVFGGSFNPVHNAHIKTALFVKEKLRLNEIIIVPSGVPPHKSTAEMACANARLEMCRLAFEKYDTITVSDIETGKSGISYTYETLEILSERLKDTELYFICGADMFLTLEKWKNPQKIFSLAKIVTVPRGDDDVSELEDYAKKLENLGAQTVILNACKMSESSSEIRKRLKAGETVDDMLPKTVLEYINKNKLYGR